MPLSIVRDERFLDHDPGRGHPESPERLRSIESALRDVPWQISEISPKAISHEALCRAHAPAHVDAVYETRGRFGAFDGDTTVSPGSVDAAEFASGAAAQLALSVADGGPWGMALVRPPGHHAPRDRAMGFCLFNHVAVAAEALRVERGIERILIYDFDVHHGNGTESIFWEDPNVFYMSTHQSPFYPGTGASSDRGAGAGEGATLNLPLPAGSDDETLLTLHDEVLLPAARAFSPEFVLLSAGFDGFTLDPLGGFKISEDGFHQISKRWVDFAGEVAGGRLAAVLEGGYNVAHLGSCVRRFLEAWV